MLSIKRGPPHKIIAVSADSCCVLSIARSTETNMNVGLTVFIIDDNRVVLGAIASSGVNWVDPIEYFAMNAFTRKRISAKFRENI